MSSRVLHQKKFHDWALSNSEGLDLIILDHIASQLKKSTLFLSKLFISYAYNIYSITFNTTI